MTETLADRFQAEQSRVITWDGLQVHSMYEVGPLSGGAELLVRFVSVGSGLPEQGIRLKVLQGHAVINDERLSDIVLWAASAPDVIRAEIEAAGRKPVTVRVWNCWRDSRGTIQAWIGNSGILVESSSDGRVRLECSVGEGEVSFDDLVVDLSLSEH
ncbi:MAG TPA: hypothetical protein VF557_14275 [Jatrophihabitans sp.]|jgi:hypothetical protein|uniref:hypothetical protein n=1 Tax=Jatrophihabitans sp. TaxID=1932789 RepID=UPI002F021019